jgi:hypothetical protein
VPLLDERHAPGYRACLAPAFFLAGAYSSPLPPPPPPPLSPPPPYPPPLPPPPPAPRIEPPTTWSYAQARLRAGYFSVALARTLF